MPNAIVSGRFKNSENNFVILEVFRPNPNGYDFKRSYDNDFDESLSNLIPGVTYIVDVTGHTTGIFELEISGDIDGSPSLTAAGVINDSLTFTVKNN